MIFDHEWFLIWLGIFTFILMVTFVFVVYVIQRKYIIKRYEEETNLAETERFFEVNRRFVQIFPFLKSGHYSLHLLFIMLMTDKAMKKNFRFRDSPRREDILSHFSTRERIHTFIGIGCGFLGLILGLAINFLSWYWKI